MEPPTQKYSLVSIQIYCSSQAISKQAPHSWQETFS